MNYGKKQKKKKIKNVNTRTFMAIQVRIKQYHFLLTVQFWV